ncbi:MAG TPA: energy-coupling factor transporter transmembrane component T [Acidimicrobiia bacterium]|nr:energy-coupling factor transporter transmembrane component T [Acidimicrobiia bacterium]
MSSSAQTRVGAARPYHAVTWFVWALAGTTAVQLASSPVYVVLVIGIAWLVVGAYGLPGPFARAFPILLTLGVVFAVLRVVLMALTTHGGLDVLFTTPSFTMPDFLGGFTVGGSIELPVVLQAGNEGLVIIGVIAVFGAFNAVASHFELVQALPRAFYEVGLVVIVALAFVPSTIGAVSDVREADRARTGGRVVRRGRLLRQLVPVLESGLERAVTLAESMDSRGFAHGGASPRDRIAGWCGAASLLALASAFVALIARSTTAAAALALAGVAGLAAAVRLASAGERRVRYRRRRFTRADRVMMAGALATPVALAVLSLAGDGSLSWAPSPLRWPSLHVLPVLALLGLLTPLLRRTADVPAPAPAVSPVSETVAVP